MVVSIDGEGGRIYHHGCCMIFVKGWVMFGYSGMTPIIGMLLSQGGARDR